MQSVAGNRVQLNLEADEPVSAPELADEEKIIYSLLQKHSGITIDDIEMQSELDFGSITSALMTLEAEGLVNNEAGRYSVTA